MIALVFGFSILVGLMVLPERSTGRSALMCLAEGVGNAIQRGACALVAFAAMLNSMPGAFLSEYRMQIDRLERGTVRQTQ